MRKAFFISLALVFAFILAEIIVRFVLSYPAYGVESSILGIPYRGKELTYKPHSKYWNVEGGNNIFSRNNIGLNGIDVNDIQTSKNIFVLGNSFIKASEVSPELMATSVFQKQLADLGNNYRVLNLGFYSHDPYQLYFLSEFFKRKYQPETVILVIERDYGAWLSGYEHPLNFNLPADFGNEESGLKFKLATYIRNSSSFVNLLASALKLSSAGNNGSQTEETPDEDNLLTKGVVKLPEELKTTILEFQKAYGTKFLLVSIIPQDSLNKELMGFCSVNKINCFTDSQIMIKTNRLNQNGHLNEAGNKLLGEKLYEFYKEYLRINK
ncbi:MAG: hypothetical protein ABI543_02620 [Ignavibacteria bacterium]